MPRLLVETTTSLFFCFRFILFVFISFLFLASLFYFRSYFISVPFSFQIAASFFLHICPPFFLFFLKKKSSSFCHAGHDGTLAHDDSWQVFFLLFFLSVFRLFTFLVLINNKLLNCLLNRPWLTLKTPLVSLQCSSLLWSIYLSIYLYSSSSSSYLSPGESPAVKCLVLPWRCPGKLNFLYLLLHRSFSTTNEVYSRAPYELLCYLSPITLTPFSDCYGLPTWKFND